MYSSVRPLSSTHSKSPGIAKFAVKTGQRPVNRALCQVSTTMAYATGAGASPWRTHTRGGGITMEYPHSAGGITIAYPHLGQGPQLNSAQCAMSRDD